MTFHGANLSWANNGEELNWLNFIQLCSISFILLSGGIRKYFNVFCEIRINMTPLSWVQIYFADF